MFGSIDTNCEIAPIVDAAYHAARDICEYHYMTAPELVSPCPLYFGTGISLVKMA